MSAHTPGPWRHYNSCGDVLVVAPARSKPDEVRIATMGVAYSPDESFANARLVSAAPELLHALRDAVNALAELATTLHPGSPAQKFADEAGFKGSAMLSSVGS